jgi:hypothetical protein
MDAAETREAKDLVRQAYASFTVVFDTFAEEEITRQSAMAPNVWCDARYHTDTTPFFTDLAGERIAVQQYCKETRQSMRKDSWLGRLGISRDIVIGKFVEHFALVLDAGYGETKEIARAETLRLDPRHDFIGHLGERPDQTAHATTGTIERDQRVVEILRAMEGARSNGDLSLAYRL